MRYTSTMPALGYDLHSHSTASDGSLSPAALMAYAAQRDVHTLALTDHDTTAGLAEAALAARAHGLRLVPGVELSVTWQRQTVHIVGLHIDPGAPTLCSGLERLQAYRRWRGEEIARRLDKHGVPGALEGAQRLAGGPVVGRTHFARFLVEQGHAETVQAVFKRFLVQGKPGHVAGDWATLEEAVSWIRAAGGQAVVAHPARYRLTATRLRRLLGEFRELGGVGLEVVSGSHSEDDVRHMAVVAERAGLLGSRGSDFHGPENPYVEIGRLRALPASCRPIWADWTPPPYPFDSGQAAANVEGLQPV